MPDFWLLWPLFICLFILFNSRYQKGAENLGVPGALHSSTPFVRDIPKIFYYVEVMDPINDFGRFGKKENQAAKPDFMSFVYRQINGGNFTDAVVNQGVCEIAMTYFILPIPVNFLRL